MRAERGPNGGPIKGAIKGRMRLNEGQMRAERGPNEGQLRAHRPLAGPHPVKGSSAPSWPSSPPHPWAASLPSSDSVARTLLVRSPLSVVRTRNQTRRAPPPPLNYVDGLIGTGSLGWGIGTGLSFPSLARSQPPLLRPSPLAHISAFTQRPCAQGKTTRARSTRSARSASGRTRRAMTSTRTLPTLAATCTRTRVRERTRSPGCPGA